MARILSGWGEIDRGLGGLEKSQVFLLTGGSGTGKTALSLVFLNEGLKAGESGLLVTSDFPEDIFSFADDFLKISLTSYVEEGKLSLLEYPLIIDEYRNPVLGFDVDDIFSELNKHCEEVQASRVVIDSLSPCFIFSANREPLDFARSMVLGLKSLGATAIITGDREGETSFKEVYNAVERLVYGAFDLKMEMSPEGPFLRNFQIKKMKNEVPEKSSFYFTLRAGRGPVFQEKPVAAPAEKVAAAPPSAAPSEVTSAVPQFAESLSKELRRAIRYQRPLSLMVLSLEEFKLGRGAEGQGLIDLFNKVLLQTSRDTDIVSRYSWDRFIVLLTETTAPNAVRFMHRVTTNLEKALGAAKLYQGQEIAKIKYGVAEHPTDTAEGEDLVASALRRLK